MTEMDRVRFITANYGRLQGLKVVPLGLLVLLLDLWANALAGQSSNFLVPFLLIAAGMMAYALIDRYYHRFFGQVEQKRGDFRADILFSIVAICFCLPAFFIDMSIRKPVSLFLLVGAIGLLLDYLMMIRRAGGGSFWILPSMPVLAILFGLIALFPLLGWEIWHALGFDSWYFVQNAIIGILLVLFGLIVHLQLAASMKKMREA
jgi:hypothetical protein